MVKIYSVVGEKDALSADKVSGHTVISRLAQPAVLVACIYILFIVLDALIHDHSALYYIHIGPRFIFHDPHAQAGYDGQFYYQIARNPLHAARFIDHPAYRYERIVYPLLVAALSLGQANLIPYLLLLVNFISIVLGTELLARMLIAQHISPWFSLAFGLYFGQASAFMFDTTEPLTYLFICLGIFLLVRQRLTAAAVCMGLAVLSRETALLFPLGFLIFYFSQRRWQDGSRLFLFSIAPTIIWYITIGLIFHTNPLSAAPAFQLIPFQGLFELSSSPDRLQLMIWFVLIPSLLSWFLVAKDGLQQRWKSASWLIWLFNLVMVSCMSKLSYLEMVSAGRLSTGLVLAILVHGLYTKNKIILWTSQIYVLTFFYYAYLTLQ